MCSGKPFASEELPVMTVWFFLYIKLKEIWNHANKRAYSLILAIRMYEDWNSFAFCSKCFSQFSGLLQNMQKKYFLSTENANKQKINAERIIGILRGIVRS